MLKDLKPKEINSNDKIKYKFENATLQSVGIKCNIFKGNYFADTFNYFPITEDFYSFSSLYSRNTGHDNNFFFTKNFFTNFKKNIDSYKQINDVYLLGSNAGNNYYSNLIYFLPRLFFNKKKKIKIAIHRNSSMKFRKLIEIISKNNNLDISFLYLDDSFYLFKDSLFPQFLSLNDSIKILRYFLLSDNKESVDKKIYVTREDANYRKIVNEGDLIPLLRSKGFKVINPQLYEINEQIKIFSQANVIISPHGSNLSNIIFCKPQTKIYEIGPKFNKNYEILFENKYKQIALTNNLKYERLISDTVEIKNHSKSARKYINNKILEESAYYKNLIVRLKDFENID